MTGYLKILNQYFTEYMHAVHVEYVKDLIIQNTIIIIVNNVLKMFSERNILFSNV